MLSRLEQEPSVAHSFVESILPFMNFQEEGLDKSTNGAKQTSAKCIQALCLPENKGPHVRVAPLELVALEDFHW